MAVRQPTLMGLPGKSPLGSYIYVLHFNVDIIKVGMTGSPKLRIGQYLTSLAPFGISIEQRWVSEPHGQAQDNEAMLLNFCRTWATQVKGEYFTSIEFGEVVAFANTLLKGPLESSPSMSSSSDSSAESVPQVTNGTNLPKQRMLPRPVIIEKPRTPQDIAQAAVTHEGPVTPYRQLADILKARIARGDWAEGRPIASETRLVQEYGLARSTVRRAIAVLVEDGVVWTVQGRGTYVGQPPAEES